MTGVSSRHETDTDPHRCAAPGCDQPINPAPTGRPARFCSDACRARAHRHHRQDTSAPLSVEVDMDRPAPEAAHPNRHGLSGSDAPTVP